MGGDADSLIFEKVPPALAMVREHANERGIYCRRLWRTEVQLDPVNFYYLDA
jgi:hypothetical protein